MKLIAALLLGICSLSALGARVETPVNQAEASAVFLKMGRVIERVLQIKTPIPPFTAGTGVASREQVLREFLVLYQIARPKFKFTAPPQKSASSILVLKDAPARQNALQLEVLGFVDRYGPLVTSKTDGLSPDEFGDAVGYFIARIAELTHTPTSKFSPYLMPP